MNTRLIPCYSGRVRSAGCRSWPRINSRSRTFMSLWQQLLHRNPFVGRGASPEAGQQTSVCLFRRIYEIGSPASVHLCEPLQIVDMMRFSVRRLNCLRTESPVSPCPTTGASSGHFVSPSPSLRFDDGLRVPCRTFPLALGSDSGACPYCSFLRQKKLAAP